MPIDASIYGQFGNKLKSIQDYQNEAAQAEGLRSENALRALQMKAAGMDLEQKARDQGYAQKLRQIYQTTTPENLQNALLQGGFSNEAAQLQKANLDSLKIKTDAQETQAKTQGMQIANQQKLLEHGIQALQASQTPQDAAQQVLAGAQQGYWSPEEAQAKLAKIPQDPVQFNAWKQNQLRQILSAKDQLANIQTRNTGGSTDTLAVDPVTGQTRVVSSVQNTISPDAALNNQTSRANAQLSASTQMRGQDMTAATAAQKATAKPLPPTALKLQQEGLDAIATASNISSDLGALKSQIDNGALQLGPLSNLISKGKNFAGASDQNSRNYASFTATLEKLRNDSLRLNKGVQTEGDAQRAWNELVNNINDPAVVKQRLTEIQNINDRAALLHKNNIDVIRSSYGLDPLDTSAYTSQPAAVGKGGAKALSPAIAPPPAAINFLRNNPGLAAQFDAKYGPGASKKALGK